MHNIQICCHCSRNFRIDCTPKENLAKINIYQKKKKTLNKHKDMQHRKNIDNIQTYRTERAASFHEPRSHQIKQKLFKLCMCEANFPISICIQNYWIIIIPITMILFYSSNRPQKSSYKEHGWHGSYVLRVCCVMYIRWKCHHETL